MRRSGEHLIRAISRPTYKTAAKKESGPNSRFDSGEGESISGKTGAGPREGNCNDPGMEKKRKTPERRGRDARQKGRGRMGPVLPPEGGKDRRNQGRSSMSYYSVLTRDGTKRGVEVSKKRKPACRISFSSFRSREKNDLLEEKGKKPTPRKLRGNSLRRKGGQKRSLSLTQTRKGTRREKKKELELAEGAGASSGGNRPSNAYGPGKEESPRARGGGRRISWGRRFLSGNNALSACVEGRSQG